LAESDVYMSYLPLAHIFDRVVEELFIFHGASIGFWRGVSINDTVFSPEYLFVILRWASSDSNFFVTGC